MILGVLFGWTCCRVDISAPKLKWVDYLGALLGFHEGGARAVSHGLGCRVEGGRG